MELSQNYEKLQLQISNFEKIISNIFNYFFQNLKLNNQVFLKAIRK